MNHKSDIKLGERYRDDQTGYEGVATSIHFYQHACERVLLESFDRERQTVIEVSFDAPRLTHIKSGKTATTTRPGGPERADGRRSEVRR